MEGKQQDKMVRIFKKMNEKYGKTSLYPSPYLQIDATDT